MASVYVLMGSDSDKEKLVESGFVKVLKEILDADDVEYSVCSAHRNAPELAEYVERVLDDGAKVFVGIAGLAAALPGALAGLSGMSIPVVAVPLDEHGIDSCIYMPPGVPVLTAGVGKNGLKNAALAVCQILALDPEKSGMAARLRAHLSAARSKKPTQFGMDPTA